MSAWFSRWCWFELMTPDPSAAVRFYTELFGWTAKTSSQPGYTMIQAAGREVGSVMQFDQPSVPPHWIGYLCVEDADRAAAAVREAGGRVVHGPAEIPGIGRFVVCVDPQGAHYSLYQPARLPEGEPPKGQVPMGEVCWHELMTSDADAAVAWYTSLYGWSTGDRLEMASGAPYQVYKYGGETMGGITQAPPGVPNTWLYYVRVPDIDATVTKAHELGGKSLFGPFPVPGGGLVAGIVDPNGAVIACYQGQ